MENIDQHRCIGCEKTFSRGSNLYRHIRLKHKSEIKLFIKKQVKCAICNKEFISKKVMEEHINHVHGIVIERETIKFNTMEEFINWKKSTEKETASLYIKNTGNKMYKSGRTHFFYCHRNGYIRNKSGGKRSVKVQGSNKINGSCPSMIKVTETNIITVEFTKTHFGHEQQVEMLKITPESTSQTTFNYAVDDLGALRLINMENLTEHKCTGCEKTFSTGTNLYRHVRLKHNSKIKLSIKKQVKCVICNEEFISKKVMEEHINLVHGIIIEQEIIEFNTMEEFLNWKASIEKETASLYIKNTGNKMYKSGRTHYFYCHRNGYFTSKRGGKRNVKLQGSNKINGSCPSMIKVTETNKIIAQFTKTHFGHDQEVERELSQNEKEKIVLELSKQIDIDTFFDEIRISVCESIEYSPDFLTF